MQPVLARVLLPLAIVFEPIESSCAGKPDGGLETSKLEFEAVSVAEIEFLPSHPRAPVVEVNKFAVERSIPGGRAR